MTAIAEFDPLVINRLQFDWHRTGPWMLLAVLLCLSHSSFALGQNFTCADPELVASANQARLSSSQFWLGFPLTARWSAPCPIHWSSPSGPPFGSTRFQFANGEVFGWTMDIQGSRQSLLADVIPHEVDHMVRASLIRRPVPRWLDEGCAGLMESPAAHEQLRRAAQHIDDRLVTADWLNAQDYPSAGGARDQLYAAGFVLTEFLLDRGGPKRLLELQRRSGPLTKNLMDLYQLSPAKLGSEWREWNAGRPTDCTAVQCIVHSHASPGVPACHCGQSPANLLMIWTSRWCAPCRRFWRDWDQLPQFRAELQSRFHIHAIDIDQAPHEASTRRINSVPTFQLADRVIQGYEGASWLKEQLGLVPTAAALQPAPEASVPPSALSPPVPQRTLATVAPDAPEHRETPALPTPQRAVIPVGNAQSRGMGALLSGVGQLVISLLPVSGILGGALATGGLGGIAVALLTAWIKRRLSRRWTAATSRSEAGSSAPFPRKLDEARQLLAIRQSEGRVAALDALRGMFLDDELDKLTESKDPATLAVAHQLRSAISRRVDEVAPISTSSS